MRNHKLGFRHLITRWFGQPKAALLLVHVEGLGDFGPCDLLDRTEGLQLPSHQFRHLEMDVYDLISKSIRIHKIF